MKCVIIDDSDLARDELRHLLQPYDYISIVGEAENSTMALKIIKEVEPDLIFLDIHLPGKSGFEVLQDLDHVPEVIFTTAYDQYALKAFDFDALDYLKKPIHEDRLQIAIERVLRRTDFQKKGKAEKEVIKYDRRVFVKDGDLCWFVNMSEIRLLEIVGNYTRIHFKDQNPMIPRSLNYMEARLDGSAFFRINRQQIVNIFYIQKVESWYGGAIKIWLEGDTELTVSRRQSIRLREILTF